MESDDRVVIGATASDLDALRREASALALDPCVPYQLEIGHA